VLLLATLRAKKRGGAHTAHTKYRLDRVLHLALCRVVDVQQPTGFVFRLNSPQKTCVFVCASAAEKTQWMDACARRVAACVRAYKQRRTLPCLAATAARRRDTMQLVTDGDGNADNGGGDGGGGAVDPPLDRDADDAGDVAHEHRYTNSHCLLCADRFNMTTQRRRSCPSCQRCVCKRCSRKQTDVEGRRTNVCDECFGRESGLYDAPVTSVE
jgi:hypothetical protein